MSVRKGDVVMGRYRIVGALAEGGMGMVFLARLEGAEGFSRPVVIKQILPTLSGDEEMVRMFVREARILSTLHHPNIVDVLDFASESGTFLMALEYVKGYGVNQWLRYVRSKDAKVPVSIALWIVAQVLDALHYAHTRTDPAGNTLGIVHRDVSPGNILLDVDGHVRLVDFGVAREMGETSAPKPGEVSIRGKFPYMAPELLSGTQPSPRSDLYACGVVLHELLMGQNEIRDKDPNVTIKRVFMHELSPVSDARSDASQLIDIMIATATAKEPDQRFESAEAMSIAVRGLIPEREAELPRQLRGVLQKDFFGDLPERLQIARLETLEELLRAPAETPSPASIRPVPKAEEPTRSAPPPPPVAMPSGGGAMRWVLAIAALLALGVSIAVLAIVWSGPSGGTERVLVVERRLVASDPPSVVEIDAGAIAPSEPAPEARPQTRAERLTSAFTRQQPRLRQCFEQHTLTLQGQPRVAVRFTVGASGRVERAELTPRELVGTPLGQCLLAAANATEFPPQPDTISFSIPIAVRGR